MNGNLQCFTEDKAVFQLTNVSSRTEKRPTTVAVTMKMDDSLFTPYDRPRESARHELIMRATLYVVC